MVVEVANTLASESESEDIVIWFILSCELFKIVGISFLRSGEG